MRHTIGVVQVNLFCIQLRFFSCYPTLLSNTLVNSRLADTLPLRTPRYYGQELKSRRIRITENNSRYFGLSLSYNGHQMVLPKVSVIKGVDFDKPECTRSVIDQAKISSTEILYSFSWRHLELNTQLTRILI